MLNFCLANKYADVLLNIYDKNNNILEECQQFLKIIEKDCLLNDFFGNKNISNEEKIKIINSLNIKESNNFFELLIINNRAEYIKDILQIFFQKYEKIKKIGKVQVLTYEKIQKESIKNIEKFLIQKLNLSQIIIENIIDKTLIGGFIAFFNNAKYDCSLKNNLHLLQKNLTENSGNN